LSVDIGAPAPQLSDLSILVELLNIS
jgi:hypothetical protein